MLRNSCNRRLRFESLEQKNLLAGDVAVSLVSGNLLIQGDAAGNNVEMQGAGAPGEFTFSGLGTTFNGSNTLTIGGVVGDVSVDLGDGLNKFVLTDASLPGSFSATLGGPTGIDDFDGYQLGPTTTADPGVTIAGNLNLAFTGGASSFQGVSLDVLGNVSITGQIELSDGVSFLDASVAGNLDVALTAPGIPVFLLGMHNVGGDVNISGDIGNLTVRSDVWSGNVPMVVGGDFNVATGDAADVISIQQVDATGSFNLDAGNGANDSVVSNVTTGVDFSLVNGASFASYSIDNISTGGGLSIDTGIGGFFQTSILNVGTNFVFNGGIGNDILNMEPSAAYSVIGQDFIVVGGDGADEIGIEQAQIGNQLNVNTGSGDDAAFVVDSTVGASALVNLGSGLDSSEIEGVVAGQSLMILASDTQEILLADVTSNFLAIITSGSNGLTILEGVTTNWALVATGNGNDDVTILDSVFDGLFVLLGNGDDTLTIGGTTVDFLALLSGGSGTDTLVDAGGNNVNFMLDFAFETLL